MKSVIHSIFKTFLLSVFVVAQMHFAYAQTASILPPAKTTFLDANGKPLTAGTVESFIPATTTHKTTWQDAAETIPNANPLTLDAAGRALLLGSGSYRQVVKDRLNNVIWDQVTSSTGSGSSGSTATGDGDLVGTIKPWAGMTAPNQYVFTYGQELLRSTYSVLFTAITSSQAVFCNSGSPILNGLGDTTNFWIGMTVELSCVAPGFTTVISKTATTVTLALNSNVTTGTNAVFFPWGRGNGSTTFNMPDFRGFVLAGNDNMGGVAANNLTVPFYPTDPNSIGASGGNQGHSIATSEVASHNHPVFLNDPGHIHSYTSPNTASNFTGGGSLGSSFLTANTASAVTGMTVRDTPGGAIGTANQTSHSGGGIAVSSTIGNNGGGYTNGSQTITVAGGTCTTQPQFTITVAGNILSGTPSLLTAGSCTVAPTNPAATTGGGGAGGTLNVIYSAQPISLIQPTKTSNYIIKVLPDDNSATASGVTALGGMTGSISCGTGVLCTGNNISVSVAFTDISGVLPATKLIQISNIQTTNYSIQISDCGKTVELGTGSTGFFTFTLPVPAGFPEGCLVEVKNGDTTRGKGISGFPTGFTQGQGVLWPQQFGSVQIVNSVWTTIARPGRAKLAGGAFNVFTNFTSGTDSFGLTDGMASGTSAFKTLQQAMYNACNEFDFTSPSQTLYTITMAANITDTTGVHYACPAIPGGQGGAQITIQGGSNSTISTTNLDAIAIDIGATISLVGITLQSTGTISGSTRPADCARADFQGQIFAINNITVQCAGSSYAAENGGKIYIISNDNDNGNSATHFFASTGGVISTDYPTGTITTTIGANITKSVAWAKAVQGGVINVPTWAFSLGAFAVTGTREITGSGGQINTGGTPLACQTTYFPGTVNGTSVCAPDFTATAWTPTITTDATPGTPTYNLRVGSYEATGRQVIVRFTVSLSAWPGAPTGNVLISGLPVATANVANDNATCYFGSYGVTGLGAGSFGLNGIILPNTSTILVTTNQVGGTTSVTAAQAGATLQFIGTCIYHT